MKKILLLLSFFASSFLIAQYQPLAVEGRQWSELYHYLWGPSETRHFHIAKDSLYKGELLPRLVETDTVNGAPKEFTRYFIKEDSVAKTIIFYFPDKSAYGDSFVFNFSLNIGDSVFYDSSAACPSTFYRLDGAGVFTDHQNTQRTHYFFTFGDTANQIGQDYPLSWVEGLGSPIVGVAQFFPILCFTDAPVGNILCVRDSNDSLIYQNPSYNTCHLSFSLAENEWLDFQTFPNPSDGKFSLQWEGALLEISIINFIGKEILKKTCASGCEINLQNQPSGLYILRVFENGKRKGSARVMKQ